MLRLLLMDKNAACARVLTSSPVNLFPRMPNGVVPLTKPAFPGAAPVICLSCSRARRTVQLKPLGNRSFFAANQLRGAAERGCHAVLPARGESLQTTYMNTANTSARFMSTNAEPSETGKALGLHETFLAKPSSNESFMLEHAGQRSLAAPSLRVVEIDVKARDEERLKRIKKDNLYGKILLASLLTGGVLMYIYYAATDVSSGLIRHMDGLLELIYGLLPENFPNPETAHDVVMWLAARRWLPLDLDRDDPALNVTVKGLTFHTPVGLAAGFDKHAEAPLGFCKMGFGFVEVGSITPKPQEGNPKPRIFRLAKDHAVINRCGFNSEGLDAAEPRLRAASKERWEDRLARRCVLGINLGKNKDTEVAEDDIREGVRRVGRFADYLVINLSSPNTKGLRALQQRDHLRSIILAAQSELGKLEERDAVLRGRSEQESEVEASVDVERSYQMKASDFFPTQTGRRPLLFVKIAPDLTDEEKFDIAQVALETGLDGLVVTNTTVQRPESLKSKNKQETGGLSGRPLKAMATQCVSDMYKLTKGQVAIIASGGIETGLDAFERIKAGASAVEVYTSMIYRGPVIARRIKDELLCILNQAGVYNVQDAVGMDHRPPKKKHVQKPNFDCPTAK